MKIFLIAGKSGSGKDEVAKIIKEYFNTLGKTSIITGYSKYLKNFVKEMYDWDGNIETKPREKLQMLGDKIREIDEEFFISNILNDLRIYEHLVDNVIISDVRMPDEIDTLKFSYDEVYAIYVENQFSQSKLSIAEQMHITETALENYQDFDYILANDNLEEVKNKIYNYLGGIN